MQDRVLRRIFILAGIAFFIWILYLLKPVVIPFLGAFLIAYLFSPLVEKLSKTGLPRAISISIVFVGITIFLVLGIWYVVPLVWEQLVYARDSIPAGIHWINETFLPWVSNTFNVDQMEIDTNQLSGVVMEYIQTNYSADSIQTMALRLAQSGLSFIQVGATVVLIPIIAFFFLLDWHRMLQSLRRLIPRPYVGTTLNIVRECHNVLGAFVKGQFLVMVLLGLVYAVGLQLIGLEVGLIIGMIAGLASIIPYLGFAVGILAAIIATTLQFGIDWMQLFLVGVVFLIGQIVESYLLQPFLLGDKIGLSPVAVVFAVLAGAQLAGFVGMLIALPVAAVIVVLLRHARDAYEESQLYGAQTNVTTIQTSPDRLSVENDQVEIEVDLKSAQKPDSRDDEKPT